MDSKVLKRPSDELFNMKPNYISATNHHTLVNVLIVGVKFDAHSHPVYRLGNQPPRLLLVSVYSSDETRTDIGIESHYTAEN